jgi:hypothetical protein
MSQPCALGLSHGDSYWIDKLSNINQDARKHTRRTSNIAGFASFRRKSTHPRRHDEICCLWDHQFMMNVSLGSLQVALGQIVAQNWTRNWILILAKLVGVSHFLGQKVGGKLVAVTSRVVEIEAGWRDDCQGGLMATET